MAPESLIFQPCTKVSDPKIPDPIFYATDLSGAYFPGRGVFVSILIHAAAASVLLFFPALRLFLFSPSMPEDVVFIELREPVTVMYLPQLDGEGPPPRPGKAAKAAPAHKTPSPAAEGRSYPGPQPILSDVPDPTNRIQTVLQPGDSNPPALKPPLPIPNLVRVEDKPPIIEKIPEPGMEMPETELWSRRDLPELADYLETVLQPVQLNLPDPEPPPPPPDTVQTEVEAPVVEEPEEPEVALSTQVVPIEEPVPEPGMEMPEMKLEPSAPVDSPDMVLARGEMPLMDAGPTRDPLSFPLPGLMMVPPPPPPPVPEREIAEEPETEPEITEEPTFAPPDTVSDSSEAEEPYLALTPLQAIPAIKTEIPGGEARGKFAVSPQPNLTTDELEPGGRAELSAENTETPETAPAIVPPEEEGIEASGTETAADAGEFFGEPDVEAEEDPFLVSAIGSAPESGEDFISGPGNDAFEGITIIGDSAGPADASNTMGASVEKDPFGGISIVGGSHEPGSGEKSGVTRVSRPLQTEYELNVISTESSGGGLPSYGVFQNEQIYTAYLDMRETESDQDPSWTIEFAQIRESDAGVVLDVDWGNNDEGLVLPFPKVKERPFLPDQIDRSYLGRMIVVYGVIDETGRMEQLTIKESPHETLSQLVLESLGKWIFRPARSDGEPVAVKVLMGIPLWLPDIQ